ncbi:MAG: polysaccharide deacetylase family protein [Treponema sp.]|nr:polysaccharide deacetylase family protein [Treponema sp.]
MLIFILITSCANNIKNVITEDPPPVMVYYEGQLINIFFHPLVARPEIAFTCSRKDHFLDWFVTANEYKKILYELYINNYVLVDIKELYEVTFSGGRKRVMMKKPLIPEGKKPLVLSIDDLSYYTDTRRYASVHKLIIDAKGNIAAWTNNDRGGEISYDLDVVTYLEEFIKKYPDFSVRGARGIIALTGFEGVLGYNTHRLNAPDYQTEKENAIAVVNRLKKSGWHFASHSWGHPNLREIDLALFEQDVNRWDREVRPILGDTDLFIYPYGIGVESIEEKHKLLRNKNFNIFFGVGSRLGYREGHGYVFIERRNIDGTYFSRFINRADGLFDIEKVIDAEARKKSGRQISSYTFLN